MTKIEFISKVYSLLDAGRIEIEGQIYYSESSVITAMEWMADNAKEIVEVDAQKMIDNMTTNLKNIMESFKNHEGQEDFDKRSKIAQKKIMVENGKYIGTFYWDENHVSITDPRDIAEIERRKKLKLTQPARNELYSVNPNFDGKYSDL